MLTCRCYRIKEYESKVAELESETDRLSQALETQKHVAEEARTVASKKADELTKEIQKKVGLCLGKLREFLH